MLLVKKCVWEGRQIIASAKGITQSTVCEYLLLLVIAASPRCTMPPSIAPGSTQAVKMGIAIESDPIRVITGGTLSTKSCEMAATCC